MVDVGKWPVKRGRLKVNSPTVSQAAASKKGHAVMRAQIAMQAPDVSKGQDWTGVGAAQVAEINRRRR
jgi:hypothetical protein